VLASEHTRLGLNRSRKQARITLVDVGRVGLLARLGALLLVTGSCRLLAGILLLRSLGGRGRSLGGGLLISSFGRHFCFGRFGSNQCCERLLQILKTDSRSSGGGCCYNEIDLWWRRRVVDVKIWRAEGACLLL